MPVSSQSDRLASSTSVSAIEPFDFDRLTFSDVSRYFGRRCALSHVTLTCRAGEIVGVLGPNGSGKSTLLGIASTVLVPSLGDVWYGDRTARQIGAAIRGRLGLLSHELQLYPELTARENLEFFSSLYGVQDAHKSAQAALERAGLVARADDLVLSFSRGMRQRIALERALLHGPRLLLLDEPFTGLDEASSIMLSDRLRDLKAKGRIILLATHDLEAVDGLVDQAIVLQNGRFSMVEGASVPLRERYQKVMRHK